jgi:hypothetical protein
VLQRAGARFTVVKLDCCPRSIHHVVYVLASTRTVGQRCDRGRGAIGLGWLESHGKSPTGTGWVEHAIIRGEL